MKILFIDGTGTISSAITEKLSQMTGIELYLLNRGNKNSNLSENVKTIIADINDEETVKKAIENIDFDVVCDFIAFTTQNLERDYRIFNGKTKQFIFISSASAYQKPLSNHVVTESTPLANPYWEYSRNKIACEDYLMKMYRENGFPITIVRPSHTYCEQSVPTGVHGSRGSWQVVKRIIEGKPVIIHGDGSTLWAVTHNSDFAKGFIGLLGNPHAIGEAFHITSDETLDWNQIYRAIAKAVNKELKPYYVSSSYLADVGGDYNFAGGLIGDKANTVIFDNSKIKKAVPDFVCTKRFDQGVKEVIDYILANPEYQIEDNEFDLWCDKVIESLENSKKAFK